MSTRKKPTDAPQLKRAPTDQEIIDTLIEKDGNITNTAIALKCARATIYNRMKLNPDITLAANAGRETLKDVAESMLAKHIRKGSLPAIFFYLSRQAKDRGYTERREIEAEVTEKVKGYATVSPDDWDETD